MGKKKAKIPRQEMPLRDMALRKTTFQEVALGLRAEQAVLEARRCIQCKKPKCIAGCPVAVDIPRFIQLAAEEKFAEAYEVIKETNSLPAICGRVCPHFCQQNCNRTGLDENLNIGAIERFLGDYGSENRLKPQEIKYGEKIAVIGSGPAGLTAALRLREKG